MCCLLLRWTAIHSLMLLLLYNPSYISHRLFTHSWKSWWTNIQKLDFSSSEASVRKVAEMPSGRSLCLMKSEDLLNRGLGCSGQKTQLWILRLNNTISTPQLPLTDFLPLFRFFLILPITISNMLLLSEVTLGSKPFWNRTQQCNWWHFTSAIGATRSHRSMQSTLCLVWGSRDRRKMMDPTSPSHWEAGLEHRLLASLENTQVLNNSPQAYHQSLSGRTTSLLQQVSTACA